MVAASAATITGHFVYPALGACAERGVKFVMRAFARDDDGDWTSAGQSRRSFLLVVVLQVPPKTSAAFDVEDDAGIDRFRVDVNAHGALELHLGIEDDFRPAKKAHPGLLVDDLTTLVTRLEAAGYATRPDNLLEGYDCAYVHDPFGNRIELLQSR